MMSDEEVQKTQNDLEMIKRPHLWPLLTLPLKRPHPTEEMRIQTALVVNVDDPGPIIVIIDANMFGDQGPTQPTTYLDAEAVIDAGWKVD